VIYLFVTIHIIICVFLILVVLLQQGKGADLSVFGGGSTMTAFGARSAATLLHKLTVGSFVAFIVTTMAIAVIKDSAQSTTVMDEVSTAAPATPAPVTPAEPAPAGESSAAPAAAAETPAAAAPEAAPAPAEGTPQNQ
jgi:preprotein translocase subunit SecG